MEAAMQAAKNFLHRDKHHDTEVVETFNPAITKETIRRVEREEQTTAIDRELHKDHYQTRIQPVEDHVRTEEKHIHNVLPVEIREIRHGKDNEIARKLKEESQRFHSTSQVLPTEHTTIASGTVAGEHVHHHVHEQVQPIIEREVIQPSVIHTTVPIHERIEHEPIFHPATIQPKMTMEEFRKAGGTLEGRREHKDVFEGEPIVKENGGASVKHPNAYSTGRHTDSVIRSSSSSSSSSSSDASPRRDHTSGLGQNPGPGHNSGVNRADRPRLGPNTMREAQMRREGHHTEGLRTPPIRA